MKKIILMLLFFILFTEKFLTQELDAKVVVNYEQLNIKHKDKLINFANVVEDYLNKTKFTGKDWEWEKIKCNFNIFFTSAISETEYNTQVVISSQRNLPGKDNYSVMLSLLDNTWSFKYEPGISLYFNENAFDPLTSFLNYYAFIMIGLDSDSYDPLGGNEIFSKALNLSALAFSSKKIGWDYKMSTYSKRGLIEEILNAKYQKFREDFYKYHMEGIELLKENRKVAQKNIVYLIENLYSNREKIDNKSVFIKVFFDSKYKEIIENLSDYDDKSIFDKLKILDPGHISKYLEIK